MKCVRSIQIASKITLPSDRPDNQMPIAVKQDANRREGEPIPIRDVLNLWSTLARSYARHNFRDFLVRSKFWVARSVRLVNSSRTGPGREWRAWPLGTPATNCFPRD